MVTLIRSPQHPLVKYLVKLRTNKSFRYDEQHVVIAGEKMVTEVCQEHPAQHLLFTDEELIPEGITAHHLFLITEDICKKIAGVESPEGIIANIPMPSFSTFQSTQRVLVLDRINDPGNMGTLIRTALAFSWDGVFLLEGCCDPFNDKALRAAKGATFRLPLSTGNLEELKKTKIPLLIADLDGEKVENYHSDNGLGLVLGNESTGVSPQLTELGRSVTLPVSPHVDSLNVAVAGGILAYLLRGKP